MYSYGIRCSVPDYNLHVEGKNMQSCKTTVVIPNYNGMKDIRDCLDSLKSLREESDFHIIVVDNGRKTVVRKLFRKSIRRRN